MKHLAHRKNILVFLLLAIGLIVLPHAFHLPTTIFGFFSFLLGWRLFGIFQPHRLPGVPVLVFVAVCGLAILLKQFHTILGRDAGTSLFVIALGLKLMELKTERDLYLVNFLAFIVATSQFLYEQSIWMAVYILFVTCVLLASLVYLNTHTPLTRDALKKAGVIVLQAIPMTIALFIFFPRVEAPRWLLFNDKQETRTGLSDSMEPGSITDLGMSDELAFRVKFEDDSPPPAQRYWRGPVLTHTDGKRWTQVKDFSNRNKMAKKPTFYDKPYRYKLMLEPQEKNWVYALDMASDYPKPLYLNENYQLLGVHDFDKRTEYTITSYPKYYTGQITETEFREARQLPSPPVPAIKQLVETLQGYDQAPEVFINNLLNHFRQEDFHYTLTPPLMEDNPIETFLFETRHGFCSHYASAFVYLMRVADIPARIVTGYQGGEFNEVGDFLEVRQADAHAWAEVWLANKGWVRIDPTAAIAPERIEKSLDISRLAQGQLIQFAAPGEGTKAAMNWLKNARQLWSNIDYNWQRWVINYNSANQAQFLSGFGINDFKKMVYWMMTLVGMITALLSLYLFYQRPQAIDPSLKLYHRFLKKLAKAGCPIQPGEGPKHFAERIKRVFPEKAVEIDRITNSFIKLLYGRKAYAKDSDELKTAIKLLKF